MAPTLTYDTSDDPQMLADAEARDQESLEIGEQLEQEQNQLLAGKYRDAEELEQAYIELQKKLGSRANEEASTQDNEEEADTNEEEYNVVDLIVQEAATGEYSEESIKALEEMSATEIADLLHMAKQQQEQPTQQALSEEDIQGMKSWVGGEENYTQLIAWAAENLSPQEVQAYDAVMDRGDPSAIYFAMQALNLRYQDSIGTEGRLLTGKAAQVTDVFRSQAEVVRAMNDPRYETDPAYRQDIFNKLERSNLEY